MRISDWSSDVCSSDLPVADRLSAWLGLDAENAEAAGFATVIALTTYVSLIAGELVPKQFALRALEPIAIFMAAPMVWLSKKIGRASCRERVCQYVEISVVAVSLTKKRQYKKPNSYAL